VKEVIESSVLAFEYSLVMARDKVPQMNCHLLLNCLFIARWKL